MSCYSPLQAFRTSGGIAFHESARHENYGPIELPCGQCIGCRIRRAQDWSLRVMHEASCWPENCFVTLTYGRDQLPAGSSLSHRDFQLFMKRLRKHFTDREVRFYMCGEYGPLNQRPHYHACLFNVDFRSDRVPSGRSGSGHVFYDSPLLSRLWSHGRVSVQDLSRETALYTAGYITKKILGPNSERAYDQVDSDGVVTPRRPEYAAMSTRPGIGARWFLRFSRDVYPHDFAIGDGRRFAPPRYYDKLMRRAKEDCMDDVEFRRSERAREVAAENTDERRKVRAAVAAAGLSLSKRNEDL